MFYSSGSCSLWKFHSIPFQVVHIYDQHCKHKRAHSSALSFSPLLFKMNRSSSFLFTKSYITPISGLGFVFLSIFSRIVLVDSIESYFSWKDAKYALFFIIFSWVLFLWRYLCGFGSYTLFWIHFVIAVAKINDTLKTGLHYLRVNQ